MIANLALVSGDIFPGELICQGDLSPGEVVLYQSQEFPYRLLTDPVTYGRIIVSDSGTVANRWPLVHEIESYSPHLKGLVILGDFQDSPIQNKYYNLINYFRTHGVTLFKPHEPAKLNATLQQTGAIRGMISTSSEDFNGLYDSKFADRPAPLPENIDFRHELDPVRQLSTRLEFIWDLPDLTIEAEIEKKCLIVAYDFGLSNSMLRNLRRLGCDIKIVPADYSPEELIALNPEGILLSGGPGHPRAMGYAIGNISRLIGIRPILATGLGHLLLGLSIGAKITIMSRPHFGENIPVKREGNFTASIKTAQTHTVSIDRGSLEKDGFTVTFTNAADGTVEGYENKDYLIQSYAFPLSGNDDFTFRCLRNFVELMESHRAVKKLI